MVSNATAHIFSYANINDLKGGEENHSINSRFVWKWL